MYVYGVAQGAGVAPNAGNHVDSTPASPGGAFAQLLAAKAAGRTEIPRAATSPGAAQPPRKTMPNTAQTPAEDSAPADAPAGQTRSAEPLADETAVNAKPEESRDVTDETLYAPPDEDQTQELPDDALLALAIAPPPIQTDIPPELHESLSAETGIDAPIEALPATPLAEAPDAFVTQAEPLIEPESERISPEIMVEPQDAAATDSGNIHTSEYIPATPPQPIQPQEMPEEPAIDKDVSGVVTPPALKVQEELRALIAPFTGVEDSDGFSVVISHLFNGEPVMPEDVHAAQDILARIVPLMTERENTQLRQLLGSLTQRLDQEPPTLPQTMAESLAAPAPRDLLAQMLAALNAEPAALTQTTESAEPVAEPVAEPAAITALPQAAEEAPPPAQAEAPRPAPAAMTEPIAAAPVTHSQHAVPRDETIETKPTKTAAPELTVPAATTPAAAPPTAPVAAEAAPPAAPVDSADIIRQLTENINLQRGESVTKLEMTLNPATLGRISIVLEQTADGLTATLKPQNESVRSLLAAHSADLQNALKDMGIRMESIRIEQPDIGWDFARGQMDQQGREAQQHGTRRQRLRTVPHAENVSALNNLTALMYGATAQQPVMAGETSLDLRA